MTAIVRRARYAKIEKLTCDILDRSGIDTYFVNIRKLIKSFNIELRSSDLGKVSGLIARDGRKAIIGVNSTQVDVRQRFTIAHELGHYLLHDGMHSHYDEKFRINYRDDISSKALDIVEIEANYFAACLLMPKKFLDAEAASECIDDDEEVSVLAKKFRVSRHAMSLRLANIYPNNAPF